MGKDFFSVWDESHSKVAEAYRSLRTNLITALTNNPCRTILVTSATAREGKTTTVINLGAALARSKKKVMLVDTDIRNPMLHRMLGVKVNGGITKLVDELSTYPVKSGELDRRSLGDVFFLVRLQERSGVLKLENKNGRLEARFYKGEIIGINCKLHKRPGRLAVNNEDVLYTGNWQPDKHPEWKIFLADVDSGTSFYFQDTEFISVDGRAAGISWELLLEQLPNLRKMQTIASIITKYIQPSQMEGLWLLLCDQLPKQPADFLSSLAVRELLRILSYCFDIVLLDSPPVTAVTDACLMVSYLDGVILVMRSRKVDRKVADAALEQLQSVEANILGVVLNDIDIANDLYYYRQYCEYNYNHGKKRLRRSN
jgi:Mrp family chromosome partitioning ATPase